MPYGFAAIRGVGRRRKQSYGYLAVQPIWERRNGGKHISYSGGTAQDNTAALGKEGFFGWEEEEDDEPMGMPEYNIWED